MDIVGYFASILIGVSLGLIGGGGSILTVPVLVYIFKIDAILATTYSLFIVGTTSFVGGFNYFKNGLVNLRTAVIFGIPSVAAVFLTRAFILPAIPSQIFRTPYFTLTKGVLLLLTFAVLMIFASYSMIKKQKLTSHLSAQNQPLNYVQIIIQGATVGMLTGLVGAGGGFLIIPALVILGKLPIKEAIGTSLVIIATNSLLGFFGERSETIIDWVFLAKITAFALVGIFIGMGLSKRINGEKLKPAFGWFVLAMGIYIILKETIFKH